MLQPTRRENILDLVLSNGLNLISDLQVECPFSTSDHHLVKFSINTSGSEDKVLEDHDADHLYYDFRGADYDSMEAYLSSVNWFYEFSFVFNVEDYWRIFVYHLNTAIEAYVPVKRRSINTRNKKKKA